MDDLRRDINEAFENGQAKLGDLGGVRERLLLNALAARDVPHDNSLQLAAGIAAVLIAAVVIATFVYVRAGNQPTHSGPFPPQTPAPPVASPSPPASKTPFPVVGMVTVDVDLADGATSWILLTNCIQPMNGKCHYSVTRSADGGRTWSKPVQVGPSFDPTDGGAPRTLRFINGSDGFAYGGSAAFVTHDGGRSWKTIGLQISFVASIAGHGNRAWLMTYPCKKGTLCPYEVRSSADAGRNWSSPYDLPLNFSPYEALALPNDGLLLSSDNVGDMELTLDAGANWRLIETQCKGNNFRADVATSDGNELWELCVEYPSPNGGPANKRLFVSEDGGTTWSQRAKSQVDPQQAASGYSMILVSPSARTAVMASDRSTIAITRDAGVTWTEVGPDGVAFASIRFASAREGWALDVTKGVWVTHDGGDHWIQWPPPA